MPEMDPATLVQEVMRPLRHGAQPAVAAGLRALEAEAIDARLALRAAEDFGEREKRRVVLAATLRARKDAIVRACGAAGRREMEADLAVVFHVLAAAAMAFL